MTRYSASVSALKFYCIRLLETGSNTTTCVISGVTVSPGDFMVNIDLRDNPPVRYGDQETGRRKIIATSGSSFGISAPITGQTRNQVVALYTYQDVTQYLQEGSLKLSLSSKGNSEAAFTFLTEPDPSQTFIHAGGWDDTYIHDFALGFTIAQGAWAVLADLPITKAAHSGFTANGEFYTALGYTGLFTHSNTVHKYNMANDSWDSKTALATARSDAQEAEIDNYGYICGGRDTTNLYNTLEKYDPGADSWTALTTGDALGMAFGRAINLCNTFFAEYYLNSDGFTPLALYYLPIEEVWTPFFVNHPLPARILAAPSHKSHDFKVGFVGGTTDEGGDPNYTINNHTFVNFIAGCYYNNLEWPTYIMDPSSGTFDHFGLVAGGQEETSVYLDITNFWVYNTDQVWVSAYDLPSPVAAGRGAAV